MPLVLLALLAPGSTAFAQADRAPAHFTGAQAQRGDQVFRRSCADCHSSTEFKGAFFMNRWTSGTVFQLFDFLRSQMPIDNPGSLSAEEYVAVIAYLLQLNELRAGDRELPTDMDALKLLVIARPENQER